MAAEESIIVGIDFGTTYSGVAWTNSKSCQSIRVIASWAANMRHCSNTEKVPTALSYDDEGQVAMWGHGVPADKPALRWFKLLLLKDEDIPRYIRRSSQFQEARRHQGDCCKDPVDIAAAFLKHLWEHSLELITRDLGTNLVDKSIFHIVLTVPALWPPYAHDRMRKVAKKAGMLARRECGETTLRLISEPEAAALAVVSRLSKNSTVMVGDTLVVCDMGGGTTDIISYVVQRLNPFEVKECVKGRGILCGGVFLDEEFLKLVEKSLGSHTFSELSNREKKKMMNDNWEHKIKAQFDGKPGTWAVEDLPAVCDTFDQGQKRRRELEYNSHNISNVFEPVARKIQKLLLRQLEDIHAKYGKAAEHIIMVGGLGRSAYLHDRLKAVTSPSTSIHQPMGHEPWTAVCQGAVMYGSTAERLLLPPPVAVKSRVARASYGATMHLPWDRRTHRAEDKVWCKYHQEWRAENQMDWFIVEGQDVDESTTVTRDYFRHFDLARGRAELKVQKNWISYTTASPPPSRSDDCVQDLCTIKWHDPVSISDLPTETNRYGKTYHVLEFAIEMTCSGGIARFSVIHKGKQVASRKVRVEYH